MLLLSLPWSWNGKGLADAFRSSFTPGLDRCSHASTFSNEFLCFYERVSPVPSCWVLACVWACSVTATEKLNKQLGSKTRSLGLCAAGIPERMGMKLILGEWESIQLLGNKLNLTNENCSFIWIAQTASFSQYLPNNQVLHPTSDMQCVFQFLDFHPNLWLCFLGPSRNPFLGFLWLLPGVPLWLEMWMPLPNPPSQTVGKSWASLRQALPIASISYSCYSRR